MKIRSGFVSNSSSSSFICSCCKEIHEGYNENYGDISKIYCEQYHCICSDCVVKDAGSEYEDKNNGENELFEKFCPLCILDEITDRTVLRYILSLYKLKTPIKDIKKEMKLKFKTLLKLEEFMGEN